MAKRILVVEDSKATADILSSQLSRVGYEVSCAENGLRGLDVARQFRPDLVLCDVMMPEMDGLTFCRHIKSMAMHRYVPVIMLTAKIETKDIVAGLEIGADDYVIKPYKFEELKARIGAMLRIKSLQEELLEAHANLKHAQMHIIHSAKMAAVGQLGAGIAHELNQPLTAIRGYAMLLQRLLSSEQQEAREYTDIIVEQSRRMADIISNVRTFSHQRDYQFRSEDLRIAFDDAISLLRTQLQTKGVTLNVDWTDGLPHLQIDPLKFQQVFLNVLQNALDAVEEVQHRTISVRAQREDEPRNAVIVDVEDSGRGIASEIAARMFEPFFTTKDPDRGTGLGLSVSLAIVKAHRGDLSYIAPPHNKGAIFRIVLPVDANARLAGPVQ